MEFLFSNYPPMKMPCRSFTDMFYELFSRASRLDIAVGYVSTDSLAELQKVIELNKTMRTVNLIIGMQYFDHFTKTQYEAAKRLNDFLKERKSGEVSLVNAFRFHGKMYSYSNEKGPFAGIIGSNNLSGIVETGVRTYESAVLFEDAASASQMRKFIDKLKLTSAKNIRELEVDTFNMDNKLLEGHEGVEYVPPEKVFAVKQSCTDVSFAIPIKPFEDSPKSNLNAYFGKGREGHNGLVKPRHWYEVELIVPKYITSSPGYPRKETDEAVFQVVTDDGWTFKCKVSGDYSKNFRSEGDLTVLGKWLKGRLENAGVLIAGEPVGEKTLADYGRRSFTLTKTKTPGIWYLDFGVKK